MTCDAFDDCELRRSSSCGTATFSSATAARRWATRRSCREDDPSCCIQIRHCIGFAPDATRFDPRIFAAFLQLATGVSSQFAEQADDVSMQHLTGERFEQLLVPVPPLEQQREHRRAVAELRADRSAASAIERAASTARAAPRATLSEAR